MIVIQSIATMLSLAGVIVGLSMAWTNDPHPNAVASAYNAAALFFLAFCVLIK
jgi:hypothetical protein